jgi:glycine betaine/choline ABC-type transport system substrate-binding protein
LAEFINPVSLAMTPAQLVEMNFQNETMERSPADIAREWRVANGF